VIPGLDEMVQSRTQINAWLPTFREHGDFPRVQLKSWSRMHPR